MDRPTRGTAIFSTDLIISLISSPSILSLLGSNGHRFTYLRPSEDNKNSEGTQLISTNQLVRRYSRSAIDAFGR